MVVALDLPGKRGPDPYPGLAAKLAAECEAAGEGARIVYPSWPAARLCNLHLEPARNPVQQVDPTIGEIRVITAGGQVRYAAWTEF